VVDGETPKYQSQAFFYRYRVMFSSSELEELVRRTIILYNRYRSPEAVAKLVRASPEAVTIEFSGSFCYSCGVLDYIEDFIYEFKILTDKVELRIGKISQTSPISFEADFRIRAL
jgi:hypothetical protein